MENFKAPKRKVKGAVEFPNYKWLLKESELRRIASLRAGMSQDTLYRRFDEIAEFIRESCRVNLKLPQVTIATATVFFQRYFVPNVLPDDRRTKIIAFACVFLAAKVEDCTKHPMKSLESVIRGMHRTDVKIKAGKTSQSLDDKLDAQQLYELREDVLMAERDVLKTLCFDMNVDHPYQHILPFLSTIEDQLPDPKPGATRDPAKATKTGQIRQIAWNFTNDSLRTTLCLQFPPRTVAAGCIYLACTFLKYLPKIDLNPVYRVANCTQADVMEISTQIFDMYDRNKQRSRTPQPVRPHSHRHDSHKVTSGDRRAPRDLAQAKGSPANKKHAQSSNSRPASGTASGTATPNPRPSSLSSRSGLSQSPPLKPPSREKLNSREKQSSTAAARPASSSSSSSSSSRDPKAHNSAANPGSSNPNGTGSAAGHQARRAPSTANGSNSSSQQPGGPPSKTVRADGNGAAAAKKPAPAPAAAAAGSNDLAGAVIEIWDDLDEAWRRATVLVVTADQYKLLYNGEQDPEVLTLPPGTFKVVSKANGAEKSKKRDREQQRPAAESKAPKVARFDPF